MAAEWGRQKVGDLFDLKPGFAYNHSHCQEKTGELPTRKFRRLGKTTGPSHFSRNDGLLGGADQPSTQTKGVQPKAK